MATQTSLAAEEYVTIDVLKANDLIRSDNYGYLDVRTEEEFRKGHVAIGNPLNIAYMFNTPQGRVKNPKFLEQVLAVCNKDDHLIVGCQSGVRSVDATIDLQNADFKHVYNMGGGYLAWAKNDLSVTQPKAEDGSPVNVNQPNVENGLHTTLTEPKVDNGFHVTVVEPEVENDLPANVTEPEMEKNQCLPQAVAEPEVKNGLPVTVTVPKIEL